MMANMKESMKDMNSIKREYLGIIYTLKKHVQDISARNEKIETNRVIIKRKMNKAGCM